MRMLTFARNDVLLHIPAVYESPEQLYRALRLEHEIMLKDPTRYVKEIERDRQTLALLERYMS